MSSSTSYVRRPQGVPVVYVLVAVVAALLAGMFIGRSGVKPVPAAQVAGVDTPPSDSSLYEPATGSLNQCKSENRELIAALDRAGGDTRRFRGTDSGDDGDDSYDGTRSESTASGRRTSFGGQAKKEPKQPIRQTANVRVWAGRAQKLANRPDVLTSGAAYNRESVLVDGVLYVTLVSAEGVPLDETSIPMALQPGRTEWQHVFRWVPDDKSNRYTVEVEWETMSY